MDINNDQFLFSTENLLDSQCKEFTFYNQGIKTKGFAILSGSNIHAYHNACPHTGAPLNWQENEFLNLEKSHIQCTLHGACFEIDSGLCIFGPCLNKSLQSIDIKISNSEARTMNANLSVRK